MLDEELESKYKMRVNWVELINGWMDANGRNRTTLRGEP